MTTYEIKIAEIVGKHGGATSGAVAEIKAAGYKVAAGVTPVATTTGYYPAKQGGGYADDIVAAKFAVTIEKGCPAFHGTVAYLP